MAEEYLLINDFVGQNLGFSAILNTPGSRMTKGTKVNITIDAKNALIYLHSRVLKVILILKNDNIKQLFLSQLSKEEMDIFRNLESRSCILMAK